jgi:murein DD-endopeptidase MepM/ murein hydrolase activator NlpD
VRRTGEDGALSPGFLAFLIAAATGIFFFLQIGHANVLATESRTAADAAALAAAEHLRFRLDNVSMGSTVSALDRGGACDAADAYARRNRARVTSCELDAESLVRPQYAVTVTVEGLDGPIDGPSDGLSDERPNARARAEVDIVIQSPGDADPQGLALGHPLVGSKPRLAPLGGSDRWHGADGWEEFLFQAAGGTPTTGLPGATGYAWPVCAPVTSEFGPRWGRLHAGIDQGAPTGTALGASKEGRVTRAGWGGGYGNLVIIDHGGGWTTRYAHMSAFAVSVGDTVELGEYIGDVGNTGNSTGPHLHFEIRFNGAAQNPRNHLPGNPC